ncbi:MAG: DUF3108 domain-containing protein [Gammaproteobacteria bacterium]|nr:DUF3108 domain-containing protein [Gammaproteobacteria bacterium]MBU1409688.1 DUF3108 domain-containing protein [Gammaproteobacteria bacterium]MBU1533464.1 DUF3108 domain-containing protein [Gammaproteobacteria bacterium]
MARGARAWWLAVVGSLLLHAALLGGLRWTQLQWQAPSESPAIEARLVPMKPVAAPRPPVKPAPPPPRARPAPPPPPAETVAEAAAPESPDAAAAAMPVVTVTDELPVIEAPPANPPAAEAEAAWPPLNALPPRLDLRFQVHYGLARGEQTLVWINEGEAYTLTSVASATGLAGVFYRGRFVQTSRGRITPRGLAPEEFWDQRGDKRSSARFDSANDTLTLTPAKGAPRHFAYQGEVQDALSLFFQLALTAPPGDGALAYTVFNGKKLRNYAYEVRGETILETALGALRTLHLARRDDGDGRFEIWLAIDRYYLPVRVLRSDDRGSDMALELLSISP